MFFRLYSKLIGFDIILPTSLNELLSIWAAFLPGPDLSLLDDERTTPEESQVRPESEARGLLPVFV